MFRISAFELILVLFMIVALYPDSTYAQGASISCSWRGLWWNILVANAINSDMNKWYRCEANCQYNSKTGTIISLTCAGLVPPAPNGVQPDTLFCARSLDNGEKLKTNGTLAGNRYKCSEVAAPAQ